MTQEPSQSQSQCAQCHADDDPEESPELKALKKDEHQVYHALLNLAEAFGKTKAGIKSSGMNTPAGLLPNVISANIEMVRRQFVDSRILEFESQLPLDGLRRPSSNATCPCCKGGGDESNRVFEALERVTQGYSTRVRGRSIPIWDKIHNMEGRCGLLFGTATRGSEMVH